MQEENDRRTARRPGRPKGRTGEGQPTREQVVDAAERLLTAKGHEGMSLQEVAEEAGLTKAALYHYFPDGKNQMILAVGHRMIDRDGAALQSVLARDGSLRDRLEAVTGWALGRDHQPSRMLREAARSLSPEESGAIFARFVASHHAPIDALLQTGVASGELRPHDTGFTAWALLSLISEFGADADLLPVPDLARRIVELLWDGIAARPNVNP